jgi:hypothetical protein
VKTLHDDKIASRIKALKRMYPKDTQIPIKRSLKFFEENNGKLLPLRTDESKEWVIFTWIGRKPKGEKKFFKSSYTVVKNIGFYSLYVDALSRDIKQGLAPDSRPYQGRVILRIL